MLVYDTEIKHCIPDRGEVPSGAIKYCDGWSDFTGMGISVLVAYDTDDATTYIITDDGTTPFEPAGVSVVGRLDLFDYLIGRTDYVVGFNNHSFDDKLLAAHGITVPREKSYDIYSEVIDAAGLSNAPFKHRKGYRLDDIARVNDVGAKTNAGAMAPVMYQQGKLAELHEYCHNDVLMTAKLLERISLGTLRCPRSGNVLGAHAVSKTWHGATWDFLTTRKELDAMETILQEIAAERKRQDEKYGARHDDQHDVIDWQAFIEYQLDEAVMADADDARERFIKVAALAVAAVESYDRKR